VVACHEAGHAVAAWLTPQADSVRRVTIVPHGRALGATHQLPGEDAYNYSRGYLLARLAVLLAGRAAEEIEFGEVTTGAEQDLVAATRLARRMVTSWAMGGVGLAAYEVDDAAPFLGYDLAHGRDYSEAMAAEIDREVQRLLADRHEAVRQLLGAARPQLERVIERLLHDESIDQDGLRAILGPRPAPADSTAPATGLGSQPDTSEARRRPSTRASAEG